MCETKFVRFALVAMQIVAGRKLPSDPFSLNSNGAIPPAMDKSNYITPAC
jgi:hypothetical protein